MSKTTHRLTGFFVLALLAVFPWATPGQTQPTADDERKATFVSNFIKFVNWPADAFEGPSDAFRVEILGRDPFNGWLDRLLANKKVNDRRIVVVHSAVHKAARPPHVLFVSASEASEVTRVLAADCHAPVLTVSDIDHFANRGGVIGLIEDDHVLHFAINQTAAGEARLRVSSQLFHLAVPLFSAVSPCATPQR